MGIVRPHLWFDSQAVDAAEFYVSIIPNSWITTVRTAPPGIPGTEEGVPFLVELVLDGMPVTALNGGPSFALDEAFSLYLECETQEEVDRYWELLTAGGGKPGPCGWLTDRYGVSWQVVPRSSDDVIFGPDRDGAARAVAAMLQMGKLDAAALQAAYAGA